MVFSMRNSFVAGATAFVLAISATQSHAAPVKKHPVHAVKGQGQIAGGNGRFGTVYSLKNGFNFEIISAGYTLEPFAAYTPIHAKHGEKLLVMQIAIKNATDRDNFFNDEDLFTLIDNHGQQYRGHVMELASAKLNNFSTTLRPGQGFGQPGLHDPLTIAFELPGNARIVKIMVDQKALGMSGDVLRYYVAGATKEEAGEAGDPKNVIAPLPDNARDTSDPSGATALDSGKGEVGVYEPSGNYYLKLEKFEYSTTETADGNPPEDGKKWAIATVTAKSPLKGLGMFDVTGGDFPLHTVETADGDKVHPSSYRKATSDKEAEHQFDPGDEYTFRIFFPIDKDATIKKLTLGCGDSPTWDYDVSSIQ
jgi:hypothetical protein